LRRRHSREFDAIVLYADECVPSTNEQLATELENDAADVAQRTIGAAESLGWRAVLGVPWARGFGGRGTERNGNDGDSASSRTPTPRWGDADGTTIVQTLRRNPDPTFSPYLNSESNGLEREGPAYNAPPSERSRLKTGSNTWDETSHRPNRTVLPASPLFFWDLDVFLRIVAPGP
jgi:hypothetical protein